jgi:hypothetical protein
MRSGLPTQTIPEGMDRRYHLTNARVTNARVARWATHQVAGTGRPAAP